MQEDPAEHEPLSQHATEEEQAAASKYEEVLQQMMQLPMSQLKKLVVRAHEVVGLSTNNLWHLMSQLPVSELESLASRASEAVDALRAAGMALVAGSSQEGEGRKPDGEGSEGKASGCGDSDLEGGAAGSQGSAQPTCPSRAACGLWHAAESLRFTGIK